MITLVFSGTKNNVVEFADGLLRVSKADCRWIMIINQGKYVASCALTVTDTLSADIAKEWGMDYSLTLMNISIVITPAGSSQ